MLLATTCKKLRESDKNRSSGWSSDSPTSFFADNSHSIKNWTRCLRPRSHGIIISRGTCPQQQISFSFVLYLKQFSLTVFIHVLIGFLLFSLSLHSDVLQLQLHRSALTSALTRKYFPFQDLHSFGPRLCLSDRLRLFYASNIGPGQYLGTPSADGTGIDAA